MSEKSMGFVGGGRATRIFLSGLSRAGKLPRRVVVSDTRAEALSQLQGKFPEIQSSHNDNGKPAACDIVFLAARADFICQSLVP